MLRADGFQLGVGSYLKVTQVWLSLAQNDDKEELLDYLTPLFVKSQAEQQRFREKREVYRQLLDQLPERAGQKKASSFAPGKPDQSPAPPKRLGYFLASLFLGLVVSLLFVWLWRPPSSIEEDVEIKPPAAITGCLDSLAFNYNPEANLACDSCCVYEIIGCMEKGSVNYDSLATQACEACCEDRDSISWVPVPPVYAYTTPGLEIVEQSNWQWLARYKEKISYLIPILFGFLFLGWFFWRRARQDFVARQQRSEHPPFRLPIKIRKDKRLALDERFGYVLDRLRGREEGERYRMDIRATINATVRKGGFPNLRFRHLTRPADYLILINKQTEQNHQAQLFEYVYQYFVREEIYAERFFFDGDLRLCWNKAYPKGLTLEQLLQRYGQSRLLVFSDGYSFIDPCTGQLELWTKQLEGWQHRILMTPTAAGNWNFRESRINELFKLLPVTIKGMLELVRHFDQDPTPSLREWKYELEADDREIEVDEEAVVASLRPYLTATQLRWVAGCAIYPELHWDLTMAIGETLHDQDTPIHFTEVKELARLPWFKEGYMPQEVRRQLLDADILSGDQEQRVRAAIVDMLLVNAPEQTNSYAHEEYQLHLALNQLLLSKLPTERQRWMERYRKLHGRGLREDAVSMVALDRQYNRQVDFVLPRQLIRRLFSRQRLVLGWNSALPLLLSFLVGLATWSMIQLLPDYCPRQAPTLEKEEAFYCLSSPEDILRYYALRSQARIDSGDYEQVNIYLDSVQGFTAANFSTPGERVREDALLRENYFDPVLGRLWQTADSFFIQRDYDAAAEAYQFYDRFVARLDTALAERNIGHYFPATVYREWLGLAYFFAEKRPEAEAIAERLQALEGRDTVRYPNLSTYLKYVFVDSAYYGRIRVRTKDGYYGFIDLATGEPTWSGDHAPYDDAYAYHVDSITLDTVALVTSRSLQCLVNLREDNLGERCFNRLIRFKDDRSQLFGYLNENNTIIIKPKFIEAGEFTADDLAWVKRSADEGYGYIRKDGSDLLPANNFRSARDFKYGFAVVKSARTQKYGYLNTDGRLSLGGIIFSDASDFDSRGRAIVTKDGIRYTINTSGDCIRDCPPYRATGVIRDAKTNRPIANAQVRVEVGNTTTEVVKTNRNGAYTIEVGADVSTLRLSISAGGYRDTLLQRRASSDLSTISLSSVVVVVPVTVPEPECVFEGYIAVVKCTRSTRDTYYTRIKTALENMRIEVLPHSVESTAGREGTICHGEGEKALKAARCVRAALEKLGILNLKIEACENLNESEEITISLD